MSKETMIYVSLLDEGTAVWRPVAAALISESVYQLLGEIPEDELWEFQSGQQVVCESRKLSEGQCLVAVRLAPENTAL